MQRLDLVMDDPTYELELKQTLTIKPHNFYIHTIPRKDKPRLLAIPSSTLLSDSSSRERAASGATVAGDVASLHPLYVLYGSNTGSSEAFAQRLASAATSHGEFSPSSLNKVVVDPCSGFRASLGTLDSATEHLPKDGPILIVTASFEGQPADNAKHFVEWLENVQDAAFSGIKYAVFGCGNKDWVNTYQRIPTLIDRVLGEHGAKRLVDRGEGDAAAAEFFESFDKWERAVWETLGAVSITFAGAPSDSKFPSVYMYRSSVLLRRPPQPVSKSRLSPLVQSAARSCVRRILLLARWLRTEC